MKIGAAKVALHNVGKGASKAAHTKLLPPSVVGSKWLGVGQCIFQWPSHGIHWTSVPLLRVKVLARLMMHMH